MATGTHTLLERITVGSAGAASVTFSSIPQTGYTDLVLELSYRGSWTGGVGNNVNLSFNGLTTNFSSIYVQGDGATTYSGTLARYVGNVTTVAATASTFSNDVVYICNYSNSSVYKSYSVDSVTENNATTAYATIIAGLWSSSAAITSITLTDGVGNFQQYSTFSLYGIAASGVTPTLAPKAVGGDIIQTDGTYWYHAFINTGAFVPATGLTADVLVVAGGGGGGADVGGGNGGGGGGAGGLVYTTSQSFGSGTSHTTTVGAGGAGGSGAIGTSGTNSNVTGGTLSLTAAVGGGGGAYSSGNGATGGSGGGGGGTTNGTAGTGTASQGFAGGAGTSNRAGGGGGSGAVGGIYITGGVGGLGGAGVNTYSSWLSAVGLGVSGYIAGGGGGGGTGARAAGGSGGGGFGGCDGPSTPGTAGTANTGSGGGGGSYTPATTGNAGGSGLIIIRYPV